MRNTFFAIFLLVTLYFVPLSYSDVSYKASNLTKEGVFKLNHLIISDSEQKVLNLRFPENVNGKVLIMDIPLLNTPDFADYVKKYFDNTISRQLIENLKASITKFLTSKGQKLVTVIIPNQNIARGELRLVVVQGSFSLAQLYLTSVEKSLEPFIAPVNAGQLITEEVPAFFSSDEFARLIYPFFGDPITLESVIKIIDKINEFAEAKETHLAAVQIPNQSTEGGLLKIGIKTGTYPLKKIVLAESSEKAAAIKLTPSADAITVVNMPVYSDPNFKELLKPFIGEPISVKLVAKIQSDLVAYAKKHDRAIVNPTTPYLDLVLGEIRLGIQIGKYKNLHFSGNRWYSDELLEKRLGIKPGDDVKTSQIDSALIWTNQSPFRQVQMLIDTMGKPPGTADLDVAVQEVLPLKLAVSYSNAVDSPLGASSYSSNLQVGNLWGLDQEFNMQYSTNNTPKYDQSYSFDYKIPLPWHDTLRFDVAYSLAYPQALYGYVGLNEKAKNTVADVTYSKSIAKGIYSYHVSAGIDYKQVNTNMFFGEFTQPISTYDIAQGIFSSSISRKDKHGSWILAGNINLSPGGVNYRNSDKIFGYDSAGTATNRVSQYESGRLMLERDQSLPLNVLLVSRIQAQLSTTNLEGSEEFVIGGGATIRGYSESLAGDQGFVINEELHSPYFQTHLPFLKKKTSLVFNTQFLAFWDYGQVSYKHPILADVPLAPLMGTGIGIRTSLTGHFNMGADFGWQLRKPIYYEPHTTRGSFWATLAY